MTNEQQSEDQVIIIAPNADSLISTEAWQPISEIRNSPYLNRIRLNRGFELLSLLNEVEAVTFNTQGKLVLSSFFTSDQQHDNNKVARLLGYLAEALIVRGCNNDLTENRKWANYARRCSQLTLDVPDKYIAVGTGLVVTRKNSKLKHLYNKINSSRDICWVHKEYINQELLMLTPSTKGGGSLAGIQVKVSMGMSGAYVVRTMRYKSYQVPVVYFDLGNDFTKTKDLLLKPKNSDLRLQWNPESLELDSSFNSEKLELYLLRGRDINLQMHEALVEYSHLLKAVVYGKIQLEDLVQQIPEINTALIIESAQQNIKNSGKILIV